MPTACIYTRNYAKICFQSHSDCPSRCSWHAVDTSTIILDDYFIFPILGQAFNGKKKVNLVLFAHTMLVFISKIIFIIKTKEVECFDQGFIVENIENHYKILRRRLNYLVIVDFLRISEAKSCMYYCCICFVFVFSAFIFSLFSYFSLASA